MRPYLFCLLTIALLGLLWYLDNLLPTRGWAMQAADGHWTMDGSRSGWGIMREAWPLTLVGFLVSFAITIGLWSVVEKKATDAANQRVADRNNWLSQQESDLEERKNAFLTERATTRAEAVLKLKQAEAERDSAVLKLKPDGGGGHARGHDGQDARFARGGARRARGSGGGPLIGTPH